MGIKKESIFGNVRADIGNGYDSFIIANPIGQIKHLHENAEGYIALFRKNKGVTSQYHYKREDIEEHVNDWVYHNWRTQDSYVSMNTFFTPKRLVTNLKEIRTAFVDIDCQNIGISAEEMALILERDYYGKSIPKPNLVIYSGRGLNLIWFLNPISGLAIARWGRLQKAIYNVVKSLGADSKSSDAARVFRIAGGHNTKNGAQVYCVLEREQRYEYDEIVTDYFPELRRRTRKPQSGKKRNPGLIKHLHTERTLLIARMNDINTLVDLRAGKMQGCREYALFLQRYWSLALQGSKEEAIDVMLMLNSRFGKPLREREALADTKSAERYYDSGEPFKTKHETLIEWLDISIEEQRHLSTIISPGEKRRRDTAKQRDRRRDAGVQERGEYENARQSKKAQQLKRLQDLQLEYPDATQKILAEKLGVSVRTVKNYVAELGKN